MNYYVMASEINSEDDLVVDDVPDFIKNDDDQIYEFGEGKVVWKRPVPVVTLVSDDTASAEVGDVIDAPGIGAPLVSQRVKDILERLEVENIQFFPIRVLHKATGEVIKDYYIFNVIGEYDLLDYDKSAIERSKRNSNLILDVESLAFKDTSELKLPPIFILGPISYLFVVDERIKSEFEKHKIYGFNIYEPKDYKLFK